MSTKVKLWKLKRKTKRAGKKAASKAMDVVDVAREVLRDAVDSGRESIEERRKHHALEGAAREIAVVAAETVENAAHRFKVRQESKGAKSNGRSKSVRGKTAASKPRARKRTTKKKA